MRRYSALTRMMMVSLAIHAGVIVIVAVAPWRFFPQNKPPLVSYTVDLVASDRLGGSAAPKSAPGAKRGVALPPAPKAPEAKAPAAKAPEAKAPAPKAPEAKAPAPKAPEAKAPAAKAPEAKAPAAKAAPPKPEPPKPVPPKAPAPKPAAPKPPPPKAPEAKAPAPKAPEAKRPPAVEKVAPVAKPPAAAEKPVAKPEPAKAAEPEAEAEPEVDPEQARQAIAEQMRDEHLAAAIARARDRVKVDNEEEGGTGLGGSGGGGVVQGLDFLLYKGVVENSIRQNWAWAGQSLQLKVVVGFGIGPDGRIFDVAIVESSGDANYDALALRAVQSSDPLPAPPEQYQAEFSRYELELRADEGTQ